MITLRWSRRRALAAFLVVFILSHVVSALAPGYALIFAMRFVGAFAYAGFWAVGSSAALAMVSPDWRGRAMSVVAGGLTVATVVGLPAGTWLGQQFGWRGAFWVVTVLSSLAALVVMATVPALRPDAAPSLRSELRGLKPLRLWVSYAMTAVATTALLATFSYLAAMLIETTGIESAWVPIVLLGYGIGALIGIVVGGRMVDRHPQAILGVGFAGLLITSALLALMASHPGPTVVLVVVLGLLGFGTNPALTTRLAGIAPHAPTLALSGNVSAYNVGIAVGPWLGGVVLASGNNYPLIPAVGAVVAVFALALWAGDLALQSRRRGVGIVVGASPH